MSPTRKGGNYFASKHFQSKKRNKLGRVKDLLRKKKEDRKFKGEGNRLSEEPSTSGWQDPVRQRFPALDQNDRQTFAGLLAIEAAPDQRQVTSCIVPALKLSEKYSKLYLILLVPHIFLKV